MFIVITVMHNKPKRKLIKIILKKIFLEMEREWEEHLCGIHSLGLMEIVDQ